MAERWIIHSDINHCYAQIEEMKYPSTRLVPMAVGGHEESRHGIILAKNDLAKACGVKTGESLREAIKKCPDLLIIHPRYDDYIYYTNAVKDIYRRYSDRVESFGLDEAWIDITHSAQLFGDPVLLARKIQKQVEIELGLKVSMGVSYNKVFAKIGSDISKHQGFLVVTKDNYQDIIWPLPIEDLFYVGYRTAPKLRARGIGTIGDLAKKSSAYLHSFLGKFGDTLWCFANGYDGVDVSLINQTQDIKSIGNGITAVRDMESIEDLKMVFYVLVESVATRLKEQGLKGDVISIALRNSDLASFSRQMKIDIPTNTASEIMETVMFLVHKYYQEGVRYRSINVTVAHLGPDDGREQLSFFVSDEERQKEKHLDEVIDQIREKYGHDKIKRLVTMQDQELTGFDPLEDHIIHPVGYF
ncbi:MAG: DNA polymerase IV [Erysipelotrichaceae bacterium]|nr:DNA polymerase IV [Erysipelotrichaceae bacterium]